MFGGFTSLWNVSNGRMFYGFPETTMLRRWFFKNLFNTNSVFLQNTAHELKKKSCTYISLYIRFAFCSICWCRFEFGCWLRISQCGQKYVDGTPLSSHFYVLMVFGARLYFLWHFLWGLRGLTCFLSQPQIAANCRFYHFALASVFSHRGCRLVSTWWCPHAQSQLHDDVVSPLTGVNPIQHLWDELERRLRACRPTSMLDLTGALVDIDVMYGCLHTFGPLL